MSKQFRKILQVNPGIMFTLSFFLMAAVNSLVIFGANLLVPEHVVLGTMSLSLIWAVVLSSSALSLLTVLAMPLVRQFELKQKRDLTPFEMIGIYFVLNFIFLWVITRASNILGLGVSSWFIALVLAAVLDFFQGFVMMQVEKMRTE